MTYVFYNQSLREKMRNYNNNKRIISNIKKEVGNIGFYLEILALAVCIVMVVVFGITLIS